MRSFIEQARREEGGAVLVFSALAIVVLLGFAALAVDLGHAWAERRTSQSAADAAVMAGGLEYLASGAASNADVISVVKDYANRNEVAFNDADWLACTDPEGASDGYTPLDPLVTDCISSKQGLTGSDEFYLRVKLPDTVLDTFFASVIGFDQVTVSAFAEAEVLYSEQSNVLPLSIPHDYSSEECLGTPPSGHLKLGELVTCTGPDSGNFGLIDSPFFEQHEVLGLTENSCHMTPYPNFNTRAPYTLARGLDHPIQVQPDSEGPIQYIDLGSKANGIDSCDADTVGGYVPWVLHTQTGNRDLIAGLTGPGTYDGEEGRLRQGTTSKLAFNVTGSGDFALDNVGLWEYLVDPLSGSTLPPTCDPDTYATGGGLLEGRAATDAIVSCVTTTRGRTTDTVEFSEALLDSPRFALVPVLAYGRGDFTGGEYRAVEELVPVYIHTTWYGCKNSTTPCWFQPDDWTSLPDPYSILFNPGEGSASPLLENKGKYEVPKTIDLEGVVGIVLEWDWLVDGAKNKLGQTAPLEVSLFR